MVTSGIFRQLISTCIATSGVFSLGMVMAWSSTALPDIELAKPFDGRGLSTEAGSWVASISMLGALAASPIAGMCVDYFGRKWSIVGIAVPFVGGWILISFSNQVYLLMIGRFITGFCGGFNSLAAPVYISEIAEQHVRGTLASIFQLIMVMGILLSYILGTFLPWNYVALVSAIGPFVTLILMPFIPETPRYYMKIKKREEALECLCWLRGKNIRLKQQDLLPQEIQLEVLEIETSIKESEENSVRLHQLFHRTSLPLLKPIAVSLSLMVFEQISGFNAIIFYTNKIFSSSGSEINANVSSIIVGIVQVIATIVSTFLVDRLGRRILLLIPQIVMAVALFALGLFFYLICEDCNNIIQHLKWLPMVCLLTFIIAFSIGIGPLSWTLMGEILPPNVKGASSALATSLVWACAFLVTKSFDTVAEGLGIYWCFWLFAICCLIGFGSIYLTVPETKGKSLEEIQKHFKSKILNETFKVSKNDMIMN